MFLINGFTDETKTSRKIKKLERLSGSMKSENALENLSNKWELTFRINKHGLLNKRGDTAF